MDRICPALDRNGLGLDEVWIGSVWNWIRCGYDLFGSGYGLDRIWLELGKV